MGSNVLMVHGHMQQCNHCKHYHSFIDDVLELTTLKGLGSKLSDAAMVRPGLLIRDILQINRIGRGFGLRKHHTDCIDAHKSGQLPILAWLRTMVCFRITPLRQDPKLLWL